MDNDTRQQKILSILANTYPNATIALSYQSPWELLVAVILSAQCTDIMVNKVTKTLFAKYPTFASYLNADLKEFEKDIKSTGFYHHKAKNILGAATIVHSQFHDVVPKTMSDILTLPGVARKTANVVLGNAYGVVEGIAVDTHVIRLSQRLRLVPLEKIGGKHTYYMRAVSETFCHSGPRAGILKMPDQVRHDNRDMVDYIKDASPIKIESELMKVIPKSQWFSLTYQLIDHGRAVCKAQKPNCAVCPLSLLCPASRIT